MRLPHFHTGLLPTLRLCLLCFGGVTGLQAAASSDLLTSLTVRDQQVWVSLEGVGTCPVRLAYTRSA